jgi:hypothetical protein
LDPSNQAGENRSHEPTQWWATTLDDIDAEILEALRKFPFSSVRTIGDSLGIPASTVDSHLVERIGFKNYILRWVPHMLTVELREKRVQLSTQLLQLLESQQRIGFRDIVTGDESWILQHYDHRQIWCVSADEVPTKVSSTITAPESMLTVFLSVREVAFTNWLPSGGKSTGATSVQKYWSHSLKSCTTGQ